MTKETPDFQKFLVALTEYTKEGNKIAHLYFNKKEEWTIKSQQAVEKLWQFVEEHSRQKQIEVLEEVMRASTETDVNTWFKKRIQKLKKADSNVALQE